MSLLHFANIFPMILSLASLTYCCKSQQLRFNQLADFAEEYGMQINPCNNSKVACMDGHSHDSGETECSAIPQDPSTSPFVIALNIKETKGKAQVWGTVKSISPDESYIKFAIEAKQVNRKTGVPGKRIGKFINYNRRHECFVTYSCGPNEEHDVGMSCANVKISKRFEWSAPSGWSGELQFIATVIKSPEEFWIVHSDVILIS